MSVTAPRGRRDYFAERLAATIRPEASALSIAEAAELTGVSAKTIRRRISDGTLKAVRIGPRLIRIDRASLEAWGRPLTMSKGER